MRATGFGIFRKSRAACFRYGSVRMSALGTPVAARRPSCRSSGFGTRLGGNAQRGSAYNRRGAVTAWKPELHPPHPRRGRLRVDSPAGLGVSGFTVIPLKADLRTPPPANRPATARDCGTKCVPKPELGNERRRRKDMPKATHAPATHARRALTPNLPDRNSSLYRP
jgi:hypothetical protein